VRAHHVRGVAALAVGTVLMAVAAAMHYGPAVGVAIAGIGVAFLGMVFYNTPNPDDDRRR
jgi:hypothetical protein